MTKRLTPLLTPAKRIADARTLADLAKRPTARKPAASPSPPPSPSKKAKAP